MHKRIAILVAVFIGTAGLALAQVGGGGPIGGGGGGGGGIAAALVCQLTGGDDCPMSGAIRSSVASGANAFAVLVNGGRIDVGEGADDYWYSTGTTINTPAGITATGNIVAGGVVQSAAGGRFQSLANTFAGCGGTLCVDDPQGFLVMAKALPTCAASLEGAQMTDAAAGVSTGARTRVCLCTSDGAGTPAYAWQNLITGTVGTSTTCSP